VFPPPALILRQEWQRFDFSSSEKKSVFHKFGASTRGVYRSQPAKLQISNFPFHNVLREGAVSFARSSYGFLGKAWKVKKKNGLQEG